MQITPKDKIFSFLGDSIPIPSMKLVDSHLRHPMIIIYVSQAFLNFSKTEIHIILNSPKIAGVVYTGANEVQCQDTLKIHSS